MLRKNAKTCSHRGLAQSPSLAKRLESMSVSIANGAMNVVLEMLQMTGESGNFAGNLPNVRTPAELKQVAGPAVASMARGNIKWCGVPALYSVSRQTEPVRGWSCLPPRTRKIEGSTS